MTKGRKQAGAELGQAQLQLELEFTLIKVWCIILMITNYHYLSSYHLPTVYTLNQSQTLDLTHVTT